MKAPARGMKILRLADGRWIVTRDLDGAILAGPYRTYRVARNRHAALSMGISYRAAARLGN